MTNLILGPIVGHVTKNSARIWAHTDQPAQGETAVRCEVFLDSQGTRPISGSPFPIETSPEAGLTGVCEIPLPEPDRRYYYRLIHDARKLHDDLHTFMTLPEQHPDRLAFAVASCHQPFKYKQPRGTVMWRALRAELIREQARFLLLVGDQVYADEAGQAWQQSLALSEDDPSRFAKRLRLYRSLYPQYLGLPDVREAMADIPQYMIWDDHEITNGWGSEPEHAYLAHQSIFQAARKAYVEFQHSHNPQNPSDPSALYYGFHVGKAAFLVLDLRGHRQSWNRQLLGDAQRDWIVRFVRDECSASQLLFVVSSVPMFHLSPRWTWFPTSDVADQWSHEINKADRKWLLDRLFDWLANGRTRQVFILGGDVHVGTFAEAKLQGTGLKIVQATSSPISNRPAGCLDSLVRKVSSSFAIRTESQQQVDVSIKPRYPSRNFLVVTIDRTSDPSAPIVRFKMHWEGKKNPDPYPGEPGSGRFGTWLRRGRFNW
ncbi:MAG: alkaline phosphatase D family protein [Nitrospirota bacterium]